MKYDAGHVAITVMQSPRKRKQELRFCLGECDEIIMHKVEDRKDGDVDITCHKCGRKAPTLRLEHPIL